LAVNPVASFRDGFEKVASQQLGPSSRWKRTMTGVVSGNEGSARTGGSA